MSLNIINQYFPGLSEKQLRQFDMLEGLYRDWNEKINVISRKDIDFFYERHVLHSLAICRYFSFQPGEKILDIGTGGGFPGIPLAIMYPECSFTLVDSVGKKITVVQDVAAKLGLKNVKAVHGRAEELKDNYDNIVSRAVAPMLKLVNWGEKKLKKGSDLQTGFLLLKGGDLEQEIRDLRHYYPWLRIREYPLKKVFSEEFFESKKLIHISI